MNFGRLPDKNFAAWSRNEKRGKNMNESTYKIISPGHYFPASTHARLVPVFRQYGIDISELICSDNLLPADNDTREVYHHLDWELREWANRLVRSLVEMARPRECTLTWLIRQLAGHPSFQGASGEEGQGKVKQKQHAK
ncbi:MAG: hypothetical protein LBK60_08825 [Verrucomicrobiales bacterium]|jgi:hypothetical protein|nr:hypothetical protein [Verrucomicrobiales bacterium]